MAESSYTILEATEKTGLKSHTLRYWEEQLALKIHRNNLGQRIYTDEDIELFLKIKNLKDQGNTLCAIKRLLETNTDEIKEQGHFELTAEITDEDKKQELMDPNGVDDKIEELLNIYTEMVKVYHIPPNTIKDSLLRLIEETRFNPSTVKDEIACTEIGDKLSEIKNERDNVIYMINAKMDDCISLQREMVELMKENQSLKGEHTKKLFFRKHK